MTMRRAGRGRCVTTHLEYINDKDRTVTEQKQLFGHQSGETFSNGSRPRDAALRSHSRIRRAVPVPRGRDLESAKSAMTSAPGDSRPSALLYTHVLQMCASLALLPRNAGTSPHPSTNHTRFPFRFSPARLRSPLLLACRRYQSSLSPCSRILLDKIP